MRAGSKGIDKKPHGACRCLILFCIPVCQVKGNYPHYHAAEIC